MMQIRKNKTFRRFLEKTIWILPDKWVVALQYRVLVGRWPNLKDPKRFTEKVNWYKLNYHDPIMTQCVDKHLEKAYLKEKGFEDYLPKTLQVGESIEEIDFDTLPEAFIIKCNNGYGNNVIVRDKSKMDKAEIYTTFNEWHSSSPVVFGREWAFVHVKPKIMVEELLVAHDSSQKECLNDYKVMCFNGVPRIVWVDMGRSSNHSRNFYDINWNPLHVESDCPTSDYPVEKPSGLNKMLDIASVLSKDFPFVRVDFYCFDNRVYIGEMTFYPWSGCVNFKPDSFDFELGEMFKLPQPRK